MALAILDGLVIIAAAGTLALAFRPTRSDLSNASAIGLLAAGVLVLAFAAAQLRVHLLADEWLTVRGTADALDVADSALTAHQIGFALIAIGLPLLLGNMIAWGVVIHRHSALPDWLLKLPQLSVVVSRSSVRWAFWTTLSASASFMS